VPAALEVDPEGAVLLIDLSTEPLISTLWPTCGVSFASSASSRYLLAVPDVPVVAPAAVLLLLAVELGLAGVTFRTNPDALLLEVAVPVVPVVPAVALADSRWRHPVTVI